MGFCRESLALQDALYLSSPVYNPEKCETKKDEKCPLFNIFDGFEQNNPYLILNKCHI